MTRCLLPHKIHTLKHCKKRENKIHNLETDALYLRAHTSYNPTSCVTRHPCMELAPHITRFPTSSVDILSVIGSERYAPILLKRCIKTKAKQPNEYCLQLH
jgi:hypothetical protein